MIIERVSNGRLFPALLNGRHRIANHVSRTTISVIDASLSPDPTESPRAPRIPTSIGLLPRSHDPPITSSLLRKRRSMDRSQLFVSQGRRPC